VALYESAQVGGVSAVGRTRDHNVTALCLNQVEWDELVPANLVILGFEGERRHLYIADHKVKRYVVVKVLDVLVAEHLRVDVLVNVRQSLLVCRQGVTQPIELRLGN